jgi:ribosome-associated toxin RatA of RatAB toxin-antitoxin module
LVPYSAEQMFGLVDDIPAYPEFLPWCQGATELSRNAEQVVARLKIGFEALNTDFTTANTLQPGVGITMQLHDGPFNCLEGQWSFAQLGESGCQVSLTMQFEFANAAQDLLLGASFEKICDQLIGAFIKRAQTVLE